MKLCRFTADGSADVRVGLITNGRTVFDLTDAGVHRMKGLIERADLHGRRAGGRRNRPRRGRRRSCGDGRRASLGCFQDIFSDDLAAGPGAPDRGDVHAMLFRKAARLRRNLNGACAGNRTRSRWRGDRRRLRRRGAGAPGLGGRGCRRRTEHS